MGVTWATREKYDWHKSAENCFPFDISSHLDIRGYPAFKSTIFYVRGVKFVVSFLFFSLGFMVAMAFRTDKIINTPI